MCATGNTTFDAEFCYLDPERVVTQLTAVREVEWQSKRGKKKRKRVVVDTCQGDDHELKHSINGIGNSSTLEFGSLFARNFSVVDSEDDFVTVPCLIFTWNLTVEGQAEGAKVTFTVCFFNQPATVLYQGQRAKVINGTLKLSYEVSFIYCSFFFVDFTRFNGGCITMMPRPPPPLPQYEFNLDNDFKSFVTN